MKSRHRTNQRDSIWNGSTAGSENQPYQMRKNQPWCVWFTLVFFLLPLPAPAQSTISSAIWDGFGDSAPRTFWLKQNRINDRIVFSHNMGAVFSPEDFKAHPEWMPWVNGIPQAQNTINGYLWQPDITNPEFVEHTAQRVIAYFDAHPDKLSFALGMNDTTNFGDPASNSPLTNPRRWFRGRPDYSDLIFSYTNAVADRVAEKYPDKYIGALAYFWHQNTPRFPVRPNVVPFLCADRTQYYDPEFKAEDEALIRRWGAAGPKFIGLYDYWYGHPFVIPRITFQYQSDAIAVARESGARAWFVEMNPIEGFDSGKLWLTAQLMNRPEADAESLLAEFYQNFYGAAAGPMAQFFESCESLWMHQPGKARWLKYYKDIQQVRLFPPAECERLTAMLDTAYTAADSPVIHSRINQTRTAFAATTAVSHYWWAVGEAEGKSLQLSVNSLQLLTKAQSLQFPVSSFQDKAEGGKAVGRSQKAEVAFHGTRNTEHRTPLTEQSEAPSPLPVTEHRTPNTVTERTATESHRAKRFTSDCQLSEAPTANCKLSSLLNLRSQAQDALRLAVDAGNRPMASMEFLFNDDLLPRLASELKLKDDAFDPAVLEDYPALRMALHLGDLTALKRPLQGGEFETGQAIKRGSKTLEQPSGWTLFAREAELLDVKLLKESAHTGAMGMRVAGADAVSLAQWVRAAPGESLQYAGWMRGEVDPSSRIRINLEFYDKAGKSLGTTSFDRYTGNLPPSQWVRLMVYGKTPEKTEWVRCNIYIINLYPGQWLDVDDFTLMELVAA